MSQILKRGYFLALAHGRYLEQNIPLQQFIGNSDSFASLTWYLLFLQKHFAKTGSADVTPKFSLPLSVA